MLNSLDFIKETQEAWSSISENEQISEADTSEIICAWFEYLMLIQEFVESKRYY